MAKATNRHKPAPPGRKPAAFSAAEWVPFDQAVTRVKAALGSRELALRALLGDLRKEKDGLASSVPRGARDGSLTCEHLKPSFWKEAVFDSRTATIRVPPISQPARPNVAPAPAARDVERHSAFSDPRDSFIGNTSDWFRRDPWPPHSWFRQAGRQNVANQPPYPRLRFFAARADLDRLYPVVTNVPTKAIEPSTASSTPRKEGWQERRVKPILCKFWPPDGKPPAHVSHQEIVKQVGDAYQKQHGRTVSRNTILRAAGRLT
jgi:hypothetical protein